MKIAMAVLLGLVAACAGCGKPSAEEAEAIRKKENECVNHLKMMGIYGEVFRNSAGKRYATGIDELRKSAAWQTKSDLRCPFGGSGSGCSCTYVTPPADQATNPKFVLAYDSKPHPDGKRGVLYFVGTAEILDDAAFQQALKVK